MIHLDYETCGFHGIAVLLQYALDDDEVVLYDIWKNPIRKTLALLEWIATHPGGVNGFNLVFDWFHHCKLYTVLKLYGEKYSFDHYPEDHILDIASVEKDARDGPCVKPVTACDLMLHARKGKYQSTLDRSDIRIKRVPTPLAHKLADELNCRIPLNPLYFARRATKLANPWQVFDIIDKEKDRVNPHFKDVVLKFSPSTALKAIAVDALGLDLNEVAKFKDISLPKYWFPEEKGYAPFSDGGPNSWPFKIQAHIDHWSYHDRAREYAKNDVVYLQKLYPYFGSPEMGDNDSILACSVAAIRWRGFSVDLDRMQQLYNETLKRSEAAPKAASNVKRWIWPDLSDMDKIGTGGSTKKKVLLDMATWKIDCECKGEDNECFLCGGTGELAHPASLKAKSVLEARSADKEKDIYRKILLAGRFHASAKIIGALSGRMSGADGLNAQGIKSTKTTRKCFTFSWPGMQLSGGDFESFEVTIAIASYKDPQLEADLNTFGLCDECVGDGKERCSECEGKKGKVNCIKCNRTGLSGRPCTGCNGSGKSKKKIHGLFGETCYGMSYDDIVATKGQERDLYKLSKVGVFTKMYKGNANTLVDRLGIELEHAETVERKWDSRYRGIAKAQERIANSLQSMRQPDGIGSKVYWHEPADYVESLLGFKRYFTLENRICKELFKLAESPPTDWTNLKIKVTRRDREQTAAGAVRSALFGAAFAIQSANVRAGVNHEIQATGAGITKSVQRKVWDLQPSGVNEWVVMPMNIHDELMCPVKLGMEKELENVVQKETTNFKELVPMISIDWSQHLNNWSEK